VRTQGANAPILWACIHPSVNHTNPEQLIVEGYVMKDGDLYELTAKGLKAVEDHPTESGAS
jgi:hypothetical protein